MKSIVVVIISIMVFTACSETDTVGEIGKEPPSEQFRNQIFEARELIHEYAGDQDATESKYYNSVIRVVARAEKRIGNSIILMAEDDMGLWRIHAVYPNRIEHEESARDFRKVTRRKVVLATCIGDRMAEPHVITLSNCSRFAILSSSSLLRRTEIYSARRGEQFPYKPLRSAERAN